MFMSQLKGIEDGLCAHYIAIYDILHHTVKNVQYYTYHQPLV